MSAGKMALEFCQGQNPYWFGEKNVQQSPAGWDQGQERAEGDNRRISSGAFVCSERAALLRDTVSLLPGGSLISLPTWYITSSPKCTPRHRAEVQGSFSCIGTRPWQQGVWRVKLEESLTDLPLDLGCKNSRESLGKHCARSTDWQIQGEYPHDDIAKCSVQAALLALGSCLSDPEGWEHSLHRAQV